MQGKQINHSVFGHFLLLFFLDGYLEQLAASHATNYISIKSRAEREKKKNDKFTIGTGREKPKKDTKSPGTFLISRFKIGAHFHCTSAVSTCRGVTI